MCWSLDFTQTRQKSVVTEECGVQMCVRKDLSGSTEGNRLGGGGPGSMREHFRNCGSWWWPGQKQGGWRGAVGLEKSGGGSGPTGSRKKEKTHVWLQHWKSESVMKWEHKEKHLMAET